MLERFTYDNFKNLANNTAAHTYASAKHCALGLTYGSIKSLLVSSGSNLPTWAIEAMVKTNNTALIYLSGHLDATYIIAPAVGCAIYPLISPFLESVSNESDKKEKNEYVAAIAFISYPILGAVICSRLLDYRTDPVKFIYKAFIAPAITSYVAQQLLDAALPLPEKKSEVSETVTV